MKERKNQHQLFTCANPELIAEGQNQSWSWYITKLEEGTTKLAYFYLCVILDIFSRYIVGWMVAPRGLSVLAKRLIEKIHEEQWGDQDQLIIHSDRGPGMPSKSVTLLLAYPGITKSLSRPHVSNGNLYSESQLKTLKYRPEFPERFGCIEDTRSFCKNFFHSYNAEHCRSGIGFFTPQRRPLWTSTANDQRTAGGSECCLFETSGTVQRGKCQNLRYGLSLICLVQQTGASQKRSVGTQNFWRRCLIFN
ncbi:MAG: DDE-type integrase/transposase/recombinase [Candidatus Omnitrophota bacterium]